jgi:hypothetical protein
MISGNLNFLDPSGPLQACNGIYLYLLSYYNYYIIFLIKASLRNVIRKKM